MSNRTSIRIAILAVLLSVTACTSDQPASDADCSARISYEGVVYRGRNELNPDAPPGEPLGTGNVLECGDDEPVKIEEVGVFAVRGVAPSTAIMVATKAWQGVYVAEDLPRSEWPTELELE